MYSAIYSKTTIRQSACIRSISEDLISKQIKPRLDAWSKDRQSVDILSETRSFGADFVSAYIFGLNGGTGFLNTDDRASLLGCFSGFLNGIFWVMEFPTVTTWLRWLGINLVSQSTFDAQARLEDLCLSLCISAEAGAKRHSSDKEPTVYSQLRKSLAVSGVQGDRLTKTIAAELLDQIIAAVHGIGITLTYAMYQLSMHPSLQSALRRELVESSQSVQDLPLLNAILQETLRLYPVSPGPTFRVTPMQGTHLGVFSGIPAGVTVSGCSYTLHRHHVFSDCEKWLPGRWLGADESELKEMQKWFWAFGSGARRCIGDEVSIYGKQEEAKNCSIMNKETNHSTAMKEFLAGIYAGFETSISRPSDMTQMDGLIGLPRAQELFLKLQKW